MDGEAQRTPAVSTTMDWLVPIRLKGVPMETLLA